MKRLMTGNEAVARGAFEGGCLVATGYPGTPSTEILENLAKYKDVYSQWSPNEKVAVEVACGASVAGARTISTMKVVGLNVAMDPLMTFAYPGANGGFVLVVADDPGCSSSQNEQDNRLVAPFAKVPLVEPSDSQECKDFLKASFAISERFGVPVLFRMTTRVCHSKSLVEPAEPERLAVKKYEKTGRYCSSPALSRKNHADLERKLAELEEFANGSPLNRIEWGAKKIGVITGGAAYLHAREALGDGVSYLKLGLSHPLPRKLVREFASAVERLYVVEENDPYLENQVRRMGIPCVGKEALPVLYELTPDIVRDALLPKQEKKVYSVDAAIPSRPPVLCAGCPHRSVFYAVSKYKDVVAANDIGCYTLGMAPPLSVTDTIVCMGAGIAAGIGLDRTFRMSGQKKKVFGFIGDSTFFHSGITGLIDAVWNKSSMAVCILDNRTTAMTGHQENPGTGKTLMGEESPVVDIERIVKAVGVREGKVFVADAYDLGRVEEAVRAAHDAEELSVIIVKRPCALAKETRKERETLFCRIDPEKCRRCRACLGLGCPALSVGEEAALIDREACNGCGLCRQVCKFGAIEKAGG